MNKWFKSWVSFRKEE